MINLITFLSLYSYTQAAEYDLRIEGIEPNAGPTYGKFFFNIKVILVLLSDLPK